MINKSYSSLGDKEAMRGMYSLDPKGFGPVGFLFQAFNFVVGVAALPLRLFLRKNLGERTIRPGAFVLSIILHGYYFTKFDILLVVLGSVSVWNKTSAGLEQAIITGLFILINPYFIILILVVWRGIKHFKQKIREATNNQTGHSYYRGESKYFEHKKGKKMWGFVINDELIRMLVEPKAILKYGLVTALLSLAIVLYLLLIVETEAGYLLVSLVSVGCTGLVLIFDAVCLFFDEFSLKMVKRDKVLDMADGQIDMVEIMNQKAKIDEGRRKIQKNGDSNISQGLDDDTVSFSNGNSIED